MMRLISVTVTNYPQHYSEYGTHWNFFLTLAALPLLAKPLTILNTHTRIQFSWMAIVIGCVFQLVLALTSLQHWSLNAPRANLLSHNKEGLVSIVGYLCIYLFGLDIGLYSLPQHPYAYFRNTLTKPVHADQRGKLLSVLFSYAILYWCGYGVVRGLNMGVSRRIANLPYVLWTAAFNTTFLTLFVLIDLVHFKTPARQSLAVPGMMGAINSNALALFLIANVFTGLVNLSMQTIYAGTSGEEAAAALRGVLSVYGHGSGSVAEKDPAMEALKAAASANANEKQPSSTNIPALPIQPLNLPSLAKLRGKHVVLASSSPRRRDILAQVGIHPHVVPSTFAETLSKEDFAHDAHAYPINTATEKGKEVYERMVMEDDKNSPDLVISADTVVLVPDNAPSLSKGQSWDEAHGEMSYSVCEKPIDKADQYRMLADASGRSLQVVTGVCITYPTLQAPGYAQRTFANATTVHFFDIDPYTIDRYIDTNEGIDRAGGFAVQGLGAFMVEGITGDYNNVVGFPLAEFVRFLDTLIENDEDVLQVE
ncbi:hypothetical protein E3P77_03301 [Wallemia ichthyophaga]|nr:hypothetical protein E3P96_03877 [Wallemia ichthyophaga]TIB64020.1 hypothetical protein E3P77_03301 [Wallemia ichthyophaga]